jgi:hypothetical protein
VIVRELTSPVGPALIAAAANLAAAPEGTAEAWQLPDGTHAIATGLVLDVSGRELHLYGSDDCTLAFAAGGLALIAATVEVSELSVTSDDATAALRIDAPSILVRDVDAAATGAASVVAVDLVAGAGTIDVEDLLVTGVEGADVVGLRARGLVVRATGVVVHDLDGTHTTGVLIGAIGAAEVVDVEVARPVAATRATGVMIGAGARIEAARVTCTELSGANVVGIAVIGFGPSTEVVNAVDLGATKLAATARATGMFVAAPRRVVVRGFTVTDLGGPAAAGAVIVGGHAGETAETTLDVGFGTVERVVASAGDAAGVRAIAAASPRPVVVRDVGISEVAGAPVPATARPPRDGDGGSSWQSWGHALLADLADDAVPRAEPPAILATLDVVGLGVTAIVDDVQPFLDQVEAGDVAVIDSSVTVVSGSALQAETGLRPLWLRRTEVSTASRAGYVQADVLLIANTTWDRLGAPLDIGPGEVRAFDSIFSRMPAAVVLDADAEWVEGRAVFADVLGDRFEPYGALPYVSPGPAELPAALLAGALPPPETTDLHLAPGSQLHGHAVAAPPDDLLLTDDLRLYVGAHPPDVAAICDLYDPQRPLVGAVPEATPPNPIVDYRARDARSLLAVMLARAQQVMHPWSDRGPADLTTMLLEAVAERLDHLAYQQERAVAEGFIEDARMRRSVEDHVRPLDYEIDSGLSATTMVRFRVDIARITEIATARSTEAATLDDPDEADRKAWLELTSKALDELALDGAFEIPAGTLVANQRNDDRVIVFATEVPLGYFPDLDEVRFVEDVPAGATSAKLLGISRGLEIGRWLVLSRGRGRGGHVVRVTTLVRGTDVAEIGWDPRRPLPWLLSAKADPDHPASVVLGNVVPAHHGVPLSAFRDDDPSAELGRFRELLELVVDGGPGIELPLPLAPISIHASGYPLPDQVARRGRPRVRVLVEQDEWTRVDNLAIAAPGDEVFVLRASADGRASLRFGDGISGSVLPARANKLRLDLSIGSGREGNVTEGIVGRLLHVPVDETRGPLTGWLFREPMDVLREVVLADNPIAAIGGRDPESLDRMRYRAPLLAARPLSAITPDDYERIARAHPDVAGAHARVVDAAVRPVVRVTVLLRDEDTLDGDERLRRWAAVRMELDRARLLGFDVESVPPRWVPLDLDVVVDATPHAEAGAVRDGVIAAIAGNGGLLDPDTAGLGGDVHLAEIYRAASGVSGVGAVRVRRFRRLRLHAPERLDEGVIPIRPDEVAVVRGPARPAADGVLTVTVCGGLR